MTYSKQRLKEITALKKKAVRRIQSDICEIDASPSRKYIQEFNLEFQIFQRVCTLDHIVQAAHQANLIWIGDYHALGQSQIFAADFIRRLAAQDHNLAVAEIGRKDLALTKRVI